jgi:hypothetical protein
MKKKSIPKLAGLPILGNLLDFQKDRLSLFQNVHDRLGGIGIYTMFLKPFVLITQADYIRQVL